MTEHNNEFAEKLYKLVDEFALNLSKKKSENDLMDYSIHEFPSRRRLAKEIYDNCFNNDFKLDKMDLDKVVSKSVSFSRISLEEFSETETKNLAKMIAERLQN